jgi:tetratricopeptide (TPR) repeat protein
MNYILSILLLSLLPINLQALSIFTQANEAYQNQDFPQAIKLYKESLNDFQSLEQHFNLANAYYENKDYAHAILHYEKALIFSPRNLEILKNLNLANAALNIHPSHPSILKIFAHFLSANSWSYLFIAASLLGLLLFALSLFFLPNNAFIKIPLWTCIVIIAICLVLHTFYSQKLNSGIILVDDTPLRISPTSSSPTTTLLFPGSKIQITKAKQPTSGWALIKTLNNQEGWIDTEDFSFIWK